MDDSSAQLGGVTNSTSQLGGNSNNIGGGINNKQDASTSHEQIYTIPGVLHFIQHEFSRFEIERSQWDVDRAELQAKIAVLLGERKGQESLKSDLIRRIKMLEYALVQERAKSHRLTYGCDPPSMSEVSAPADEPSITNEVAPDSEAPFSSVSNVSWRQGRQLLRSYLQEIGYTDTIIDVRSNRVRSLLGLSNGSEQEENVNPNVITNEGTKRASESQGRRTPAKKPQQTAIAEAMILDSEAAVMANFEFLGQADIEMSDDDGISDDLDMVVGEEPDMKTTKRKAKGITIPDGNFTFCNINEKILFCSICSKNQISLFKKPYFNFRFFVHCRR